MLQAEDDLLHSPMPFTDHTRGGEQSEAPNQTSHPVSLVGVCTVPLVSRRRQQMLEGSKDKCNPTASTPPVDQLRRAPLCLQTQEIATVLPQLIPNRHYRG
jgi:hypothetical protein